MSQSIINGPPKGCGIKKPMKGEWVVVYYQIYMVGRLLDVRKGYTEDNVEKHWKVYTSEEEAAKDAALFNEDDEIRRAQRP